MKMHHKLLNFFLILTLILGLIGLPLATVHAQSADLASPDGMLNPDGTLKLDGSFSGALDLEGWDVQLDPQRGPVFSQVNAPALGDWENLGEGGSALSYYVSSIALIGTDVYVGGGFQNADSIPEADYIAMWDGSAWHAVGSNGSGNGSLNRAVYALHFDGNYLYVGGDFTDVNNHGSPLGAADYIARWDGADWSGLASNGAGNGSLNGDVRAIVDDGQYIYVGGRFTDVNNKGTTLNEADYLARWDGDDWAALGNNGAGVGALNNYVYALAMNLGGDLYAGGTFTNAGGNAKADYLSKWDGSTWSELGDNGAGDGAIDSIGSAVYAIAVDLAGNVYAGGILDDVNNGATNMPDADNLIKWNGSAWSAIGANGVQRSITGNVMEIVIDPLTQDVYVGGYFTDINNNGTILPTADRIAKWDGSNWSGLGNNGAGDGSISKPENGQPVIYAISAVGGTVYAGGFFEDVSDAGVTLPFSSNFVKWGAGHWLEVGSTPNGSVGNMPALAVRALTVVGTDVYVGGSFNDLDDQGINLPEADNIARWDGAHWNALGNGLNGTVFAIYADGSDLYVGGSFANAGSNNAADYLAKWNGSAWSAVGSNGANDGSLKSIVFAISKIGSDLYVGGMFTNVVDVDGTTLNEADRLARWDGTHWHALTALNDNVNALETIGTNLYVGGSFTDANGISEADYLVRWDGTNWSHLDANINGSVMALEAVGNDLYVGGSFTDAGNIPQADYVAKYNGSTWSALGSNPAGTDGSLSSSVRALAGIGNTLYVGGEFGVSDSSGVLFTADYIARWDGSHWYALGSNGAGDGSLNNYVSALALGNNAIYAGGLFHDVNNNGSVLKTADYVAAYGADVSQPQVLSIIRSSPNPTLADSVEFTVTFSEDVTAMISDFTLNTTGLNNAEITSVDAPSTKSVYTVTVNTGTGAGTLHLEIPDTSTIADTNGNTLVGLPYTSGPSYSVRTQTFADVPTNFWSWNYIERLYSAGITGGCGNGNFCPNASVTRAQMAVFLLVAEHGSGYLPPAASGLFNDVPANDPYARWIEQLAAEGITGGCGSGKYCPNSPVTRAQMAVFLLVAEHGSSYLPPAASGIFSDVPASDPYARWVEQLAAEGITGGCGGGNYCPNTSVNRGQMAVFLITAFNLP